MAAPNITGFFDDLKFAYVFPIVAFVLMAINRLLSTKNRFSSLMWRLTICFCLLLFLYSITVLMYQDRAVFLYLWRASSLLVSVLSIALGVITLAVIWAIVDRELRPSLWKIGRSEDPAALANHPGP